MATRRRRRNLPKRNARGRFVKKSATRRRRKSNPVRRRRRSNPIKIRRRRRQVRATPRRRRRRSNPVRTHRRRRTVMAHRRRRRRKANPVVRRRRRRTTTRSHRRRRHNPVRRHYARRHNRRGRRRNISLGGFVGKIDWKSVLFVSTGVFLGDKLSGIVSDKIMASVTMIPSTAGPWVKLAVGVLAAGLAWKYQPALGLGIAVGATNALINQYILGPAWGYVAPSLGVSGLADYMPRAFKQDNWIGQASGGPGAAGTMQGIGMNPLLQNRL